MEEVNLFIPGRVGIIGELSDLVSPFLDTNPYLTTGSAIATTIDRGIYSTVKKSPKIVYKYDDLSFEIENTKEALEAEIKKSSFYSYICGTALYLIENYDVGGIEIIITKMDLPMKKGLSSSASICLTVVEGYNQLYNLDLDDEKIKEIAYIGENIAGSKCGRLDQHSIRNNGCSNMIFSKDGVTSRLLDIKKEVFCLIVDLNSHKNTKYIMEVFNTAFSSADVLKYGTIFDMVGKRNKELVGDAMKCLEEGDIKGFAQCLTESQKMMDNAKDICKEFEAVNLHMVLGDRKIKEMTYGGKSIGSGGDGSLLLVCKTKKGRNSLTKYIEEKYGMSTMEFSIK